MTRHTQTTHLGDQALTSGSSDAQGLRVAAPEQTPMVFITDCIRTDVARCMLRRHKPLSRPLNSTSIGTQCISLLQFHSSCMQACNHHNTKIIVQLCILPLHAAVEQAPKQHRHPVTEMLQRTGYSLHLVNAQLSSFAQHRQPYYLLIVCQEPLNHLDSTCTLLR